MSSYTFANHDQPFDSVLFDFGNLERRAVSGIYLVPIAFGLLNAIPLAAFVALLSARNVPLPVYLGPIVGGGVLGGVTVYGVRKLRRYRLARAALQAWAQRRGFVPQGHAYVGAIEGRRFAALPVYKQVAKSEYAFEGFTLIVQLTSYSNAGICLSEKPRTLEEAVQLIDTGFNALVQNYCRA